MIKKFLYALYDEFAEIKFASASLAYSTLLSMIPFLIIIVAFLQSIGGLEKIYPQIEMLLVSYLKEATGTTVSQYVKTSLTQFQPRALGLTGGFFLLLTSLSLIHTIDVAFHRLWKLKTVTPIYHRIWLYWVLLILVPVALALYTGLKSLDYFNVVGQGLEHQVLLSIGTTAFLFLIYKVIPQTYVNFRAAALPAILASTALTIIQKSFLWASLRIFRQNKIYGSLVTVPIFLIWLLLVWYVVLSGVALSAFIQHRLDKKQARS